MSDPYPRIEVLAPSEQEELAKIYESLNYKSIQGRKLLNDPETKRFIALMNKLHGYEFQEQNR